jgi:hypothetical protein
VSLLNRTAVTWGLVAVLAASWGAGEALHYLPGCGHIVRLPGGTLYYGLPSPERPHGPRKPAWRATGRTDLQSKLRDAHGCAICKKRCSPSCAVKTVVVALAPPLGQELALQDSSTPRPCVATGFQARAPPAS